MKGERAEGQSSTADILLDYALFSTVFAMCFLKCSIFLWLLQLQHQKSFSDPSLEKTLRPRENVYTWGNPWFTFQTWVVGQLYCCNALLILLQALKGNTTTSNLVALKNVFLIITSKGFKSALISIFYINIKSNGSYMKSQTKYNQLLSFLFAFYKFLVNLVNLVNLLHATWPSLNGSCVGDQNRAEIYLLVRNMSPNEN